VENNIQDDNNKKKTSVFKFTVDDTILHESVVISGCPFFLTYDKINDEIKILDRFDQANRILVPPNEEEYPYNPIKFQNKEEINLFSKMFKEQNITIDNFFLKIRDYVSKFIVHHDHIIDYITALILFSYFQDKFATIPYTMFVSDNESGKSSIGDVIEVLGYRCVNMTDPTTANLFRIFGTVEAGQCILVLDEAEKMDQDKEMMSILKTGYQHNKKIQRVNQFGKQEHFHTFGLKIMLAERSPNPSTARGFLDRTFLISNFKGKPELAIKEAKNPSGKKYKQIAKDLDFLRKSLLIYRLIHFSDEIKQITTGLEGRNDELCKPLLQIFFEMQSQKRIETCLEILLDEKNNRKTNSLERDVLEVVTDLFSEYSNGIIPFKSIWVLLIDKTNGHVNQYKDHELETDLYGTIYKSSIAKMLRDRFGAKDPNTRSANTRSLVFDVEKTRKVLEGYKDLPKMKINCRIEPNDTSDSNDSISEDLFVGFFNNTSLINIENSCNFSYNVVSDQDKEAVNNEDKYKGKIDNSLNKFDVGRENNNESVTNQPFPTPVTAVTPVTNKSGLIEGLERERALNSLYRKWPGSDEWACIYCNVSDDIWYMLKHPCKGNKNNRASL
jgi:archaellin